MQPVTPLLYFFTFLWDYTRFKIHGLWPEEYAECPECIYPSCCEMSVPYSPPDDPMGFIAANWYNSSTTNSCIDNPYKISLFEHEYIKHGACIKNVNTSTDYLELVSELYDKYYNESVDQLCSTHQLWISLDGDFQWLGYDCYN